jgi:peptide/nickel transport system substrate-binding protein
MRKYDNQLEDFFGLAGSGGAPDETIRDSLAPRKLSFGSRLRLLPKVLSQRQRYTILILALFVVGGIIAAPITSYWHFTESVPAHGGRTTEGIVGEPRLINPLLAQLNDADRDLASVVFSGLYRYDGEGKLRPDLAKSMPEITSDGLSYSVTLKDNARWHDGVPVTADDIVFTVQTAQNKDYGATVPVRASWEGVTVERVSETVVVFHLRNRYAQFTGNLTLGMLPKHLWQDVKPINFTLSELNTKPVGSGPFRFASFTKNDLGHVSAYKLEAFDKFYDGKPFLDALEFKFYSSEDELIDAFNKNQIDSLGNISGSRLADLRFRGRITLHRLKMPRYYAVFFNQNQSKALSDKNVRLALNFATDRVAIINRTQGGNAFLINSPMLGGILDINANVKTYDFDPEQARAVLKAGGWVARDDGTLARGGVPLEVKITTSTWEEFTQVAQILKEQWEAVGVRVTLETLPTPQLQQVIRDRSYQSLLYGEILSPDPDPFSFWHSSQREGLGQNLALYDNKQADQLLEEARATLNPLERAQKYDEFQRVLIDDMPAAFLYSPHYLYGLSSSVLGFTTSLIALPSDRFTNVASWYTQTTRRFK